MIKHLQKRTLNLMYWTYTIIFICSLLMTDVDNIKIYAIYICLFRYLRGGGLMKDLTSILSREKNELLYGNYEKILKNYTKDL